MIRYRQVAKHDVIYSEKYFRWRYMIYLLTAIGLTPGGSSTVHIYTQTIHITTQWNTTPRTEYT